MSCLVVLPIKHNEEGKYIHNKIFNNIPHLFKNHLHVNCIQDGFVMYNDKVSIRKRVVIPTITDYMIPMYYCQENASIINFTTDKMTSKSRFFQRTK